LVRNSGSFEEGHGSIGFLKVGSHNLIYQYQTLIVPELFRAQIESTSRCHAPNMACTSLEMPRI
jgi:hypothetical protein